MLPPVRMSTLRQTIWRPVRCQMLTSPSFHGSKWISCAETLRRDGAKEATTSTTTRHGNDTKRSETAVESWCRDGTNRVEAATEICRWDDVKVAEATASGISSRTSGTHVCWNGKENTI